MIQSRVNPGRTLSKSRNPTWLASPASVTAQSNSPLDALVEGLASIGERFSKGSRAQLRIP